MKLEDSENDEKDVDCVEMQSFSTNGIWADSKIKEIPGLVGFYKISVPLPTYSQSN